MIQFALHGKDYLDAAQFYHSVWETPSIKQDVAGKGKEVWQLIFDQETFHLHSSKALEHVVYYVILAPHTNEQSDMLHRISAYPEIQKLELLR